MPSLPGQYGDSDGERHEPRRVEDHRQRRQEPRPGAPPEMPNGPPYLRYSAGHFTGGEKALFSRDASPQASSGVSLRLSLRLSLLFQLS